MKLLQVSPIIRGSQTQPLSYFSSGDHAPGSIVFVPIRNKEVPALVLSAAEVRDAKSQIRSASFQTMRIKSRVSKQPFSKPFHQAVLKIADYYATSPGAVLYQLVPQAIFDSLAHIEEPKKVSTNDSETKAQKLVYQSGHAERIEEYKNITREEFARKRSVYICVPTIRDAEHITTALERGIGPYTFMLHGSLPKKELITRWNTLLNEKHPVLIVATGSFLSLPRHDIGTLIVEGENTSTYKGQSRPFIDMRRCAEYVTEASHTRLMFADLPLRIESAYRLNKGELDAFVPPKNRLPSATNVSLIDMRPEKLDRPTHKRPFTVLSEELRTHISHTFAQKKHLFAFNARRGLSPITICQDCGNTVKDEITDAPMVLYKGKKENRFISHASGTVRSAHERCKYCDSWRLQAFGIGIELVEEEIKNNFPEVPLFVVTRDRTPTHAKVQKVIEDFYATPGSVLIGTEMAIPYLTEPIETSVVVSLDSLLSIPEWNAHERVFAILMRLREASSEHLLIQTRKPEQPVLTYAMSGQVTEFYREELAVRKQFGYPPYVTLIRLSIEGTPQMIKERIRVIAKDFEPHGFSGESHIMRAFRSRFKIHGFMRIDRSEWPKKEVVDMLRSLSPDITVEVDPTSIL